MVFAASARGAPPCKHMQTGHEWSTQGQRTHKRQSHNKEGGTFTEGAACEYKRESVTSCIGMGRFTDSLIGIEVPDHLPRFPYLCWWLEGA